MKAVLSLPSRTSYADYLAVEQDSERRHEFFDGVIVAMAGGSDEHNAVATRFVSLFTGRLPRGCRSYNSDQRFWITASTRARYTQALTVDDIYDDILDAAGHSLLR